MVGLSVHRKLGPAVIAVALLAAACSSSPSRSSTYPAGGGSGSSASANDPCAIVTTDQVGAAVGQPVQPGLNNSSGDPTLIICDYNYVDQNVLGFTTVGIKTGIAEKDLLNLGGAGLDAKPVEGLGDSAFAACAKSSGQPYCTLVVWANDRALFFQTSLSGGDPVALAAALQQLATAALF